MKYVIASVLAFGLLSSTLSFAEEKPTLKDLSDKESYSLGYQFGKNLKGQGVNIKADAYLSGFRDSLGDGKSALSQEEMQIAITGMQKRMMAIHQKEMVAQGEKNLAAGKVFMEENRKKEGVVALSSGLQYKVLVEGSGKMPKVTDEVTVNYRGSFINGKEFDSSYKRNVPASFRVNAVIPGWTQALQSMKEGSKWQLVIPPELGYGNRDMGTIPANSTLVFEVELISIK